MNEVMKEEERDKTRLDQTGNQVDNLLERIVRFAIDSEYSLSISAVAVSTEQRPLPAALAISSSDTGGDVMCLTATWKRGRKVKRERNEKKRKIRINRRAVK